MDGEHISMTPEFGRQMLARLLISRHACGQPNWLHWELHRQWLDIPNAERGSFWEFVIQKLSP